MLNTSSHINKIDLTQIKICAMINGEMDAEKESGMIKKSVDIRDDLIGGREVASGGGSTISQSAQ